MSKRIRNACLAALTAMVIAVSGPAVAEQLGPSRSDPAPGMMQGDDSMPDMDGMMSMMERMNAMMSLCEKMMGTTPSTPESEPT